MFAVGELDEFGVPFIPPRFLREPDFPLFYVGGRQAAREQLDTDLDALKLLLEAEQG